MEEPGKNDILKVVWEGMEFILPEKIKFNIATLSAPLKQLSWQSLFIGCLPVVILFLLSQFLIFWSTEKYAVAFTFIVLIGVMCYVIYYCYIQKYKNNVNEVKTRIESYDKAIIALCNDIKNNIDNIVKECSKIIYSYVINQINYDKTKIMFSEIVPTNVINSKMVPIHLTIKKITNEIPNKIVIYPISVPQKIGYLGYLLTENSLIIAPSESANLTRIGEKSTDKRFWDSLIGNTTNIELPLALDLKKATYHLDKQIEPSDLIDLPSNLSFVELFFQEMINIEYSFSAESQRNAITVTMRDGMQFKYLGSQEFSDRLQNALRKFKSSIVDVTSGSKTQTQQQEQVIKEDRKNDTKVCPMCAEEVKPAAKICRFCQHKFVEEGEQ